MSNPAGLSALSLRSIRAHFGLAQIKSPHKSIFEGIFSPVMKSDQETEDYVSTTLAPPLREWKGPRQTSQPLAFKHSITNRDFETSIEIPDRSIRRDKVAALQRTIDSLYERYVEHWDKLGAALLVAGESGEAIDGQFFFDTDHAILNSGTQSNDIEVDISATPGPVHGTTTDPSIAEAAWTIRRIIAQMRSFKDSHGEPIHEGKKDFVVVTGEALGATFEAAVAADKLENDQPNPVKGYNVEVRSSPRISWTNKVAAFIPNGMSLIRQEEHFHDGYLGPGTEFYEKKTKHHHWYGIDCCREAGYGLWQNGCLATLI